MGIIIDIEPVKALMAQPSNYSQIAENPGFKLYWHNQGRSPAEVAAALVVADPSGREVLNQETPNKKSVINALSRISGASIEQQVTRHLPWEKEIDARISFVPGGDAPLVTQGNIVAVNVYSLEQRLNKLFLGGFPLLSLLANRVHRLNTESGTAVRPEATCSQVRNVFLANLLREGSATLFFTIPVSGPLYQSWEQAGGQRDAQVDRLRHFIKIHDGSMPPQALAREMEQSFALGGDASLAAKYPLGTWMCQVIESAFSRSHLVNLLQQPDGFLAAFEQARIKFGLAEKYRLGVG